MPAELRGHRLFQRFRQPVKCFLQCCPRAGDIDSFEAFTILAEDGTTVQPELCFVDNPPLLHCIRRFRDPRRHAAASGSVLLHENPCQLPRVAAHLHVFHIPQQNHISSFYLLFCQSVHGHPVRIQLHCFSIHLNIALRLQVPASDLRSDHLHFQCQQKKGETHGFRLLCIAFCN